MGSPERSQYQRLISTFWKLSMAGAVLSLLSLAIWGNGGLRDLQQVNDVQNKTSEQWSRMEEEKTRMLFELRQRKRDPINVEREVAERIGQARPGTIIYEFQDDVDANSGEE